MLLLGIAVFLRTEADHGQQLLDLAEHPLFDHFPNLFVRCPLRIAPIVLGPSTQGKLDDLVAEIFGVGDSRRMLDLLEFFVQDVPIHQLPGVGVLVILVVDPGVGVGDVAIEQVLAVTVIRLEISFANFIADELGVPRRRVLL